MTTPDEIKRAYRNGYEQGRFEAIADIPHGVEKGYSVVAVVKCSDGKRYIGENNMSKVCEICGKSYTPNTVTQKYCSADCQREANNMYRMIRNRMKRYEQARSTQEKLAALALEAMMHGTSYGKYIARRAG